LHIKWNKGKNIPCQAKTVSLPAPPGRLGGWKMKLDKIGQVALVVHDVESAARFLEENFGWGPFGIVDLNDGVAEYKGREVSYKTRVGLCKVGEVVIELMQPLEGDTIQNDPEFLPPGGRGIHHVGFYVDDAEAAAAEFEARGGRVLQKSRPLPGATTIYLDTPQYAGVLLELIQMPR